MCFPPCLIGLRVQQVEKQPKKEEEEEEEEEEEGEDEMSESERQSGFRGDCNIAVVYSKQRNEESPTSPHPTLRWHGRSS